MMQITLDTAEIDTLVKNFKGGSNQIRRQLATLTCEEGVASLMAEIRAACPVSKKVGPAISMYRGGKMRRMQSHGHLRDYLAAMVVPRGEHAQIVIQQIGNFNAMGRPYLNYVVKGTRATKGKYIPALDARLRRSRVQGFKGKIAQAKGKHGRHWRKHVSASTMQGATRDIGMHPGTPPNDFLTRGFNAWIGKGGHQGALNRAFHRLWEQMMKGVPGEKAKIAGKGMWRAIKKGRSPIKALQRGMAAQQAMAEAPGVTAYGRYQRHQAYGG